MQIQTRDQLVTMFLKRIRRIHNTARDKLRTLQDKLWEMAEHMVETLHAIVDKAPELEEDTALSPEQMEVISGIVDFVLGK